MDEPGRPVKHALVVYFPGSGRAGNLNYNIGRVVRELTEKGHYCVSTMKLSDLPSLELWVKDTQADIIVACGGDGTVRRVLEAVTLHGIKIPVGIVPLGTGNLLAKSLGVVPRRTIDRLGAALKYILQGRTASIDLGSANGRMFAIDVGVGPLSSAVVAPSPSQKARLKMFAYVRPFLQCMSKRPLWFDLEIDGSRMKMEALGIFVTNERDLGLTTEEGDLASLRDHCLDVYVFNPKTLMQWWEMAWAVAVGYFQNKKVDRAPYQRLVARKSIVINAHKPIGYMIDGDSCATTPLDIRILPSAVRLIVPPWARKDYGTARGDQSADELSVSSRTGT